jgi:hypothetical protein
MRHHTPSRNIASTLDDKSQIWYNFFNFEEEAMINLEKINMPNWAKKNGVQDNDQAWIGDIVANRFKAKITVIPCVTVAIKPKRCDLKFFDDFATAFNKDEQPKLEIKTNEFGQTELWSNESKLTLNVHFDMAPPGLTFYEKAALAIGLIGLSYVAYRWLATDAVAQVDGARSAALLRSA